MTDTGKATCELYLITPPSFEVGAFSDQLRQALEGGPVACLQLRLKDVSDDEVRRAAEALLPICHEFEVPLLMNDRPDLAAETGCDGVHVGQDDAPYKQARELLGRDAMIGVTCKASRDLAVHAAEAGADYVAFGAFFDTTTKKAATKAPIHLVKWWSDISIVPSVAIGGITPENCGPLVIAGVNFLSVISAVWDHSDGPAAAIQAFQRAIVDSTAPDW